MRHEGFEKAIVENKDDYGLRLQYADWLEENGAGARTEFIRLQVRGWTHPQPLWDRMFELLHRHRAEIVGDGWKDWSVGITGFNGTHPTIIFGGGFVEQLSCRVKDLLQGGYKWEKTLPLRGVFLLDGLRWQRKGSYIVLSTDGPLWATGDLQSSTFTLLVLTRVWYETWMPTNGTGRERDVLAYLIGKEWPGFKTEPLGGW